ncbi:transposable element Tc1 transposase [Trichonephila clavipes]|nr:transposable element Tc1 transposase [Trichonephila clavipes]
MACRKGLSPDEIANKLREIFENESNGAIQPEVRFIAKQNSLMKIGNNGNLVLGPFDESTPCLMIVLMNCQPKLRINHLTAVKSVAILENHYIQPVQCEKKHYNWSSPRRSIRIKSQPCGSRTTVPRVYTNLGKVSSEKHNCGQKSKLSNRDRRVLKGFFTRKHKTTLPQITSKMNTHLQNPVSMKTIQRELHAANIHGKVAIPKPLA